LLVGSAIEYERQRISEFLPRYPDIEK